MKHIGLIAVPILATLLAGGTYQSHAQDTTLIAQQAYIKPSNTEGPSTGETGLGVGDNFGWSVASSGDTMVIGAPGEDSNATGVNGNQTNKFGKHVASGILGSNPIIPSSVDGGDNLEMQFDFRNIYASILSDWFRVPDEELQSVLLREFAPLPLVGSSNAAELVARRVRLYQNYPNPFNGTTRIRFFTNGDELTLRVYDTVGRQVALLAQGSYSPGEHEVEFDSGNLPSGLYFYRVSSANARVAKSLMILK